MQTDTRRPTFGSIAMRGAGVAVLANGAYTIIFVLYAVVRSSLTLLATTNESAGLAGTLLAVWASLLVPALAIALLLCPLVALLGVITALAIWGASTAWNRQRAPKRAIALGVAICAGVAALLIGLLAAGLGLSGTGRLAEALTFWVGLPLLAYIIAGGAASWELNRRMRNSYESVTATIATIKHAPV
jgi:hypothetical protein